MYKKCYKNFKEGLKYNWEKDGPKVLKLLKIIKQTVFLSLLINYKNFNRNFKEGRRKNRD